MKQLLLLCTITFLFAVSTALHAQNPSDGCFGLPWGANPDSVISILEASGARLSNNVGNMLMLDADKEVCGGDRYLIMFNELGEMFSGTLMYFINDSTRATAWYQTMSDSLSQKYGAATEHTETDVTVATTWDLGGGVKARLAMDNNLIVNLQYRNGEYVLKPRKLPRD